MKPAVLLLLALCICGCDTEDDMRRTYTAWQHANPGYEKLSFDDWYALKEHDMLPNVNYAAIYAKNAETSAEMSQAISSAALATSAARSK